LLAPQPGERDIVFPTRPELNPALTGVHSIEYPICKGDRDDVHNFAALRHCCNACHRPDVESALAQDLTGTLKKIKDTGVITLGHRESSIPFSYYDDKQQVVGYSQE
jgi:hypothetical protein